MQTGTNNPYATPISDVSNASPDEYGKENLFMLRGRLGRVRYIAFSMALILIVWMGGTMLSGPVVRLMMPLGFDAAMMAMTVMKMVIYGGLLIGSFMLAIQRAHDFDTSGWITLLFLVPLVNVIFGFVMWFIPGTRGENRFGRRPPPATMGTKVIAVVGVTTFIVIIGLIAAVATAEFQEYQRKAQQAAQAR